MIDWLAENYIEVTGVLLSILYLILSIKQNIWLWPVGIVSSLIFVLVFYDSKFYADMGLNIYYFFISIYGWNKWSASQKKEGVQLPVKNVGIYMAFVLLLVAGLLFLLIGFLLNRYTDSPLPYWDALTTSGSILATWMLTKKILQHWVVWIFVDMISMGLYIYRGLYPTSFLFLIYTVMAVYGYFAWRKAVKEEGR